MDCRQVEAKLADWSAENLSQPTCAEIKAHLRACPDCAQNWALFERTLIITSTSSQPLLSAERSRAMWQCCERHIQQKKSAEINARSTVQPRNMSSTRTVGAWWQITPRFGWVSLVGATAILAFVGLAPRNLLRPAPVRVAQNLRVEPSESEPREEWVQFAAPPTQASSFINHHTTMAFDPFADHVASTLVSDAATNNASQNYAPADR